MASSPDEIRKRIAFEREVFDALQLLARDRAATLQELADEAFRDLLKKHHRPVTVRDMLTASAEDLGADSKAGKARKSRDRQ